MPNSPMIRGYTLDEIRDILAISQAKIDRAYALLTDSTTLCQLSEEEWLWAEENLYDQRKLLEATQTYIKRIFPTRQRSL